MDIHIYAMCLFSGKGLDCVLGEQERHTRRFLQHILLFYYFYCLTTHEKCVNVRQVTFYMTKISSPHQKTWAINSVNKVLHPREKNFIVHCIRWHRIVAHKAYSSSFIVQNCKDSLHMTVPCAWSLRVCSHDCFWCRIGSGFQLEPTSHCFQREIRMSVHMTWTKKINKSSDMSTLDADSSRIGTDFRSHFRLDSHLKFSAS